MNYADLRDFLTQLEARGELRRIKTPVDTYLEMTEIADRVLRAGGPALLFERPVTKGVPQAIPVLANLFGTPQRVAMGMGEDVTDGNWSAPLREVGKLLAYLKEPEPPKGLKDAWDKLPVLKQVLNMAPREVRSAPCQQVVWSGDEVDLAKLPIQHCWPGDAAPLITWGLVVTRGPHKKRQNLGIYRQQVIGRNRVIMRWLAHRGGAIDFLEHQRAHPGEPFPVSVVLGCDPATILGAVTPVPDSLSEYQFAGLLRGAKTELVKCLGSDLQVPASAEIVLEGAIHPNDMAPEGPYGEERKAVKDFNRAQNRYKLKTRPERYAGRLRSSNRISLATNIVFFVGILPFFVTFESQSIGKMAFDLFLILMVYDFFYYLTHRFLFHGNGYFKKVHGVHHQARTRVSSVDSLLLHPWEVFIGTALFFVVTGALGLIMGTQFHVATVTAATVIYTQINQINHCRIDGEKFPWKILSWIAQSHDAHHINMHKGNYATITLLYDFLFGTLEPIHQPE